MASDPSDVFGISEVSGIVDTDLLPVDRLLSVRCKAAVAGESQTAVDDVDAAVPNRDAAIRVNCHARLIQLHIPFIQQSSI